MDFWGITEDELGADVWPDNVRAVNAFIAMSTQWRVGMGGPIGLDYAALPTVLRIGSIPRSEWGEIFETIRVLEDVALLTMREQMESKRR